MAFTTVQDKILLGVHIEIQEDTSEADPQNAFQAVLNIPGMAPRTLPINNTAKTEFPLRFGAINGQVEADVTDFTLAGGTTPQTATGIGFKIVFKIDAFIGKLTVGSVDVTSKWSRP